LDAPVIRDDLERYYDGVPRGSTRVEDFGPLTLFVREGRGWPYYARPTLAVSAGAPDLGTEMVIGREDVDRVRARQRVLGVPENFEWVHETTPSLRTAVEDSGLVVHEHPLMVLDRDRQAALPAVPPGTTVRILGPDDSALPDALTLGHLAFGEPGTMVGTAGPAELAAAVRERSGDGTVDRIRERITSGLSVVAVAVDADATTVCSGMHQPLDGVSEIVGVGTLPSARRRGYALAVTAALVSDAVARGVRTIFLSAGDSDVARIYGRLGFVPVGTAMIAEPASH
jgi:ribosomal protein S18 acetylase RimI-like enzyme